MAQVLPLISATSIPGTIRRSSGMLVAPERRISSCVMTKTPAATLDNFCSFFEADVTCIFIKSSMLAVVRSFCGACEP